ncbi:trypsin-like peptidase domain-containing protein [Pseudomonas corrugata]|uniref:trypsin-like peptidase domain-containing protein n=1 Tax=Pseudomonas corrugata TaxID=47879 RepID=UPI002234AB49|nr:trypsin-like peptidase domain-containing protein [Pseudomonas corrugata]UZE07796.1 trypsin-like peptidase domain-containing protein [Pseudomonas corrugata]
MLTQPKKISVPLAFFGLVLGAGSAVAAVEPAPPTPITPGQIIGESQLEKARCVQESDPAKYRRSRAVGRIYTGPSYGTAWRIGPGNLVLTNLHVIGENPDPSRMVVAFDYEEPSCDSDAVRPAVQVPVARILTSHNFTDSALLELDPDVVDSGVLDSFGYLGVDTRISEVGDPVYIAGHPRGGPKRISRFHDDGRPCWVTAVNNNGFADFAKYNCDTESGSSGSPVIDARTNAVIALNYGYSSGYNTGAQMSSIWPRIAQYFGGKLPEGSIPVGQLTIPLAKPGGIGVQVPVRVTQVDGKSPVVGAPGEQLYYNAPAHTVITDVSCQSGTTKWIAENGNAASCTLPSAANWTAAQSATLRVDDTAADGHITNGRVRLLSDTGQIRGANNIALNVMSRWPGEVQSLQTQAGNFQAVSMDSRFPKPLTARATDPLNAAVVGTEVTFAVTDDGGTGTRFNGGDQTPTVQTNAEGDATSPTLVAGAKAGTLQVTATSSDRTATFHLRVVSQEGDPTEDVEHLSVIAGHGQFASEGTEFALPLTTRTSNQDQDPVEAAWVTYTITNDGGTGTLFVGADQTPTATTSSHGDAVSPKLIAGNKIGFVTVIATSNGKSVTFTLIVLTRDERATANTRNSHQ